MKKLLSLLLVLVSLSAIGQRFNVTPNSGPKGVVLDGSAITQDTLVFSGEYSYVFINNLKGTPAKKKVLINSGQVILGAGFDLHNVQYFKITGSGTPGIQYGFYINQKQAGYAGVGIGIADKSKVGEIERVWVDSAGYGSWLKNEHFCDSSLATWVLDSFELHDSKFTNLFQHGTYWGPTEVVNATRPSNCNGVQTYLNPSRLGHIKIYNNIVRNVGKNGFMLCNVQFGLSEVYNNDIDTTGTEGQPDQGSGLQFGAFTSVYAHDNKINHTWLWGIRHFGAAQIRIENNSVANSGWRPGATLNWPQLIAIGVSSDFTDSVGFTIKNNQLSAPARDVSTIQVWNYPKFKKVGNVICGNVTGASPASVTVDPAVVYSTNCSGAPPPPPEEQGPAASVSIGADRVVTTSTFSLSASVSPASGKSISSYLWTKISGGPATLATPNSPSTAINGATSGEYTIRLTVTQSDGQTTSDDIKITVVISAPSGTGAMLWTSVYKGRRYNVYQNSWAYQSGTTISTPKRRLFTARRGSRIVELFSDGSWRYQR